MPLGGPPTRPPGLPSETTAASVPLALRSLPMEQISLARRLRATVDATPSNAAHRLIIQCGEAVPQHGFSLQALHVPRAVRVALLGVLFGHSMRLKEGSPGWAPPPHPAI